MDGRRSLGSTLAALVMSGLLAACLSPPEPGPAPPATPRSAAWHQFLKIEGVEGDSAAAGHAKEIEVSSFHWEMRSAAGAPGIPGKAMFDDFVVLKPTDRASPILLVKAASGEHLREMVFAVQRGGEAPADVLTYTFSDVLVAAIHQSSNRTAGPVPLEEVAFAYGRIEVSYQPMGPDGSAQGPPIHGGWDLARNVKV